MINLFQNITPKNKEKILRSLEANTLHYKKNNIVLSNNKDNIIGIVVSGYLQITKTDYNGNVIIIEELEENSIFGTIMSSLSNTEYNAIAKEDSKVILIDFNTIINESNDTAYYNVFLKNLLQIMSNKILKNNEHIEILTNKTIRNRLLTYFNQMSKKNGSKIIYIPTNYTDLAAYLAVDRSAMMRELKYLKEEGIIETKTHKIKLNY